MVADVEKVENVGKILILFALENYAVILIFSVTEIVDIILNRIVFCNSNILVIRNLREISDKNNFPDFSTFGKKKESFKKLFRAEVFKIGIFNHRATSLKLVLTRQKVKSFGNRIQIVDGRKTRNKSHVELRVAHFYLVVGKAESLENLFVAFFIKTAFYQVAQTVNGVFGVNVVAKRNSYREFLVAVFKRDVGVFFHYF